ncbi:AAA family ATPase [Spirillospora sp. NPDC049652]
MTDSNWQLAVLRDLGATQRGFADTAPAEPRPVPVQSYDPAEIAGTAQVPAQVPDAVTGGTGGFPGLPASGEPAASPSSTAAGLTGMTGPTGTGSVPAGASGPSVPVGATGPSGTFGSGEHPTENRQMPAPHADAPVAGPAASPAAGSFGASPAADAGASTGPAPTPHTDAPVAGAAADHGTSPGVPSGFETGPSSTSGADTSWGASSGGDQPSAGGAGFPGIQDDRAAATGPPGGDGQWGAPPVSGGPGGDHTDSTWSSSAGGAKPDGATGATDGGWGAPADGGAKPDNAWGVPDAGQPENAWGVPAAASGGVGQTGTPAPSSGGADQNMQGDASWGVPAANTGGADPSAQGGFPGVADQQNAEPAQPLGAPTAADASWGASAGDGASSFPGMQGPGPAPGPAPAPGFGQEGVPGPALDPTMGGRQGGADGASGQPGAGAGAGAGQGEPLLHADFAWEAAINPVLGGGEQQQDEAHEQDQQAAPSQQSATPAPDPRQQAQQAAASGAHPANELVRKNVHGDRLGKRIGRGVRKAVGGGSAMTAQQQAAFADLMARPVPSFRQIAIASVRGGAGKTTMAALLASELARHRQDRVVAIDADAELGSLPLRLGIVPQLSLFELAQAAPSTFDEVARFLSRTSEGLWVLSSTRGGRMSREFDIQTFQRALSSVSRFVSAAVVDCGAGILTGVNQEIIAQTHALVLVTPGTVDGALSARGALEWFANNGRQHVFQRAVVAMVSHAPQINADLGRAEEMLTAWGLPVVHVPYDRQVATGAALDLDKVGGATRQAATKVVYQAFARSLGLPGVQG